MIIRDYMRTTHTGSSMEQNKNIVVCEGYNIDQEERFRFFAQNFQEENLQQLCKQPDLLYGSIDFPFEGVNKVLESMNNINFLYIHYKSPFDPQYLIYDEYVYRNFPHTIQLLKQMKDGGNLFIIKKPNQDVLFVKISNIYEGEETLKIELV